MSEERPSWASILDLVPHEDALGSHESVTDALNDALAALDALDPNARNGITSGFLAVAIRALEFQLLADAQLQNMIRIWPAIEPRAHEVVSERLQEMLGFQPAELLVAYLNQRLESAADELNSRSSGVIFEDILEDILATGATELRCNQCGYHFRAVDLQEPRRGWVTERGLRLAAGLHAGRENDPLKPVLHGKASLTQATVDHVVPQSAFGPNDRRNVRLACQYCNYAKAVYRRPNEGISGTVAGASHTWRDPSSHSGLKQASVVSTMWSTRKCKLCATGVSATELTVRPRGKMVRRVRAPLFTLPWTLVEVCYDCILNLDE